MVQDPDPIFTMRHLRQRDQFYFTPRTLADLLALDLAWVYRLVAQWKDSNLTAEVEKGKCLLPGLEPERVMSNPLNIASRLVVPA